MARILIVEDDQVGRMMCCSIIKELGHTPLESPDGKHAYQTLLEDNNIDILITDIVMPEMDGRELIKSVRGNSKYFQLPIIVMSEVIDIEDISDLQGIGADWILPKPIDQSYMASNIKRCLTRGRERIGDSASVLGRMDALS